METSMITLNESERAAGAPNKTARTLLTLADALFAPTSFTRQQRQAVAAAQAGWNALDKRH